MEFKSFALKHPEYAKIFTTYLDLQTCHVFSLPKEAQATPSVMSNKVSPESHEESPSDKKDDWKHMILIRKMQWLLHEIVQLWIDSILFVITEERWCLKWKAFL